MTRPVFPTTPIAELTLMRPFTAPGLFAYRCEQARNLLYLPDVGGGDLNDDQPRNALENMVSLHRPLAAIALFLGVVALEDLIRDLGTRLVEVPDLRQYFPGVEKLRPTPIRNAGPNARPDKDPTSLSNWAKVNTLYQDAFNVSPFSDEDLPKLHDLALIRHTVAHHAAVVREVDVPRFKHWDVQRNEIINPPAQFVRELLQWLYRIGRSFETTVSEQLFRKVLADLGPTWTAAPPPLLVTLIETFNWFGKLVPPNQSPPLPWAPDYEQQVVARNLEVRAQLIQECLHELKVKYRA